MADEVEVNGIRWRRGAEGRDARLVWTATLGPATLTARPFVRLCNGRSDVWMVRLDCGEERRDEGDVHGSVGEAMAAAEPWALGLLRGWRDLGALAGQALVAAGGQ